MLTLYVKTGCPYCAAVLAKLNELGISFEEKNIVDSEVSKELLKHGGKQQVPYMEDEDPCETAKHHTPCLANEDVQMYESADIINYLEKNYSSNTQEAN